MNLRSAMAGMTAKVIKRWAGPFRTRYRELMETQWWDEPLLRRYQTERLSITLVRAYRDVPFYRNWFDSHGMAPDKVKDPDELRGLPILRKQDVLNAGTAMFSRRLPRFLTRSAHTGGTTGTPMVIRRDLWSIGNEHAFVRRQWDWAGIGLKDRCAYLTGRLIVPPDQVRGRLYRYDPILHELVLSTYHLSSETAGQYLDAMREARVVALVAYPSSAYALARACLERKMTLPLRAVLTSSETLYPDARTTIETAFQCPVFDFYGSAERVCYIHTCEKGTYHIVPEYGVTELVPIGNGERTKIVATGFWNEAMPLIRYELGDVVEPKHTPCPCGRAFPTISRIVGRPSEYIITPSGRELGAALLTHLLYGVSNIAESQIVQDARDHCVIRYVPGPAFSDIDTESLRNLVRMHLPSELRVDIEHVAGIPRTSSGKFRPIVGLAPVAPSEGQ